MLGETAEEKQPNGQVAFLVFSVAFPGGKPDALVGAVINALLLQLVDPNQGEAFFLAAFPETVLHAKEPDGSGLGGFNQ